MNIFRWITPEEPREYEWEGLRLFDKESGRLVAEVEAGRNSDKTVLWHFGDTIVWFAPWYRNLEQAKTAALKHVQTNWGPLG